MWKENVNDNTKYVFLAANSSLKGQSDFKKFEKARELKVCVCFCVCFASEAFLISHLSNPPPFYVETYRIYSS